jgi:hypothetical protein
MGSYYTANSQYKTTDKGMIKKSGVCEIPDFFLFHDLSARLLHAAHSPLNAGKKRWTGSGASIPSVIERESSYSWLRSVPGAGSMIR